ncbi:MAG TPA: hypothetical protein VMP01_14960 [Pirellulaceae bacterium]|nr:hypothetical protein [Pirellulaceae bacterium]
MVQFYGEIDINTGLVAGRGVAVIAGGAGAEPGTAEGFLANNLLMLEFCGSNVDGEDAECFGVIIDLVTGEALFDDGTILRGTLIVDIRNPTSATRASTTAPWMPSRRRSRSSGSGSQSSSMPTA